MPNEKKYIDINELITTLLSKKPNQRSCNLSKLKQYNFFKKLNWDDLLDFKIKSPYIPESWDWLKNKANTSEPFEFFLKVRFFFNYILEGTQEKQCTKSNRRWVGLR